METHRCADCKYAYHWDDRIRCNKVRKKIKTNRDDLHSNVCLVLNPANNCYFYEERIPEITLEYDEDIANPNTEHTGGSKDGH